jgi:DNA-directed RNA polymerase subunit RPC12/RpoP
VSIGGGAYIAIALSFGLAGGIVGKLKGSSFWLWFAISGLLPLFGLLAALAYRFDSDELRRRCPNCGRVTKLHDALCTRCGAELEFPDVAIAPESMARNRVQAR